jgi:hypothetical protein
VERNLPDHIAGVERIGSFKRGRDAADCSGREDNGGNILDREREAQTSTRARADTVVDAVARRDFGCLAAALHDDVHLRALLPGGFNEWHGRSAVHAAFTGWFDGLDEYELLDADIGEVGARLHLHWRLRVRAARMAAGRPLMVDQHVYADIDADDQIYRLSLLCSGFCSEVASG